MTAWRITLPPPTCHQLYLRRAKTYTPPPAIPNSVSCIGKNQRLRCHVRSIKFSKVCHV